MKNKDFINSFKLISHSEPDRKLITHLSEVYKKAMNRFNKLQINFELLNISKEKFQELLKITIYCHDFGKSSIYFQKKITQGLTDTQEKRLSEHGLISAFFGYFVTINELKFDKRLASFVFMAIRYHHLNLDNSEEMQKVDEINIENVLNIFKAIKPNINEIDKLYKYFLGIENTHGSIEVGKQADLISVKKDPIRDISSLESVNFVMKGGLIYKNELH
jgi:CRISPR-associated endonuclease/helicase Cas3